jgi:glycosyltransferase involved in cell wall biosynthesis
MLKKEKGLRNHVILYNLETDINSSVLAAGIYWIKEFSRLATAVTVYSTHVGAYSLPENVIVIEIGGGTRSKRLSGGIILLKSFIKTTKFRNETIVFHHMSSMTAAFLGPLFRFAGIPQGLWYSHSVADRYLVWAKYFVNYIFSSTESSLPVKGSKCRYIGHGIETEEFLKSVNFVALRQGIVGVGRVVPIKNYEMAIGGIAESDWQEKTFHIYGYYDDNTDYVGSLLNYANECGVQLILHGPVSYDQMPIILSSYAVIFSGTPLSVDKAVLEGALAGCFVVSTNPSVLELTGMNSISGITPNGSNGSISSQLKALKLSMDPLDATSRLRLSKACQERNNLRNTVQKIYETLQG